MAVAVRGTRPPCQGVGGELRLEADDVEDDQGGQHGHQQEQGQGAAGAGLEAQRLLVGPALLAEQGPQRLGDDLVPVQQDGAGVDALELDGDGAADLLADGGVVALLRLQPL
jgi:hypothetical protein